MCVCVCVHAWKQIRKIVLYIIVAVIRNGINLKGDTTCNFKFLKCDYFCIRIRIHVDIYMSPYIVT